MEVNRFDSFNQYCGPAVLSIFTGARTDDCADEIQKVNGKHKITGVYASDLMAAGTNMGLEFTENAAFQGRSIFWAGTVMSRMPAAQYLITIPKHFIAIEVRDGKLYICDNHTKTELELQNSARLSQKIDRVWKVTKVREYVRPYVVKTEYAAELVYKNIQVRCIQTMSDDTAKINPLGSLVLPNEDALQEIAFAIMKLTDKTKL
jgi:hypothetical protein